MNKKSDFIQSGFQILETENSDNRLFHFLKENYPGVISDNELNLNELKSILNVPVDEKVNGYGLNFVGRNVARAKYAQPTEKEVRINKELSKNFDTTKNLVLKGDNLDSLKILKNHYIDKIKCIYIDPPYNTANDNFVYPDKFDKEEAEILGLANISESDFERMEFSFKTKKSHNGWLSFMYPRLLLARDLLSKEGVIFISIDDNEQANLKLLCDEVFGEENFVGQLVLQTATDNNPTQINTEHEYILTYAKTKVNLSNWFAKSEAANVLKQKYNQLKLEFQNDIEKIQSELRKWIKKNENKLPKVAHYDNIDSKGVFHDSDVANTKFGGYKYEIIHPITKKVCKIPEKGFRYPESSMFKMIREGEIMFGIDETTLVKPKKRLTDVKDMLRTILYEDGRVSTKLVDRLIGRNVFDNPKSHFVLKRIFDFCTNKSDIILDFFAGSGTTGHAVMQLNAEDGGNRKFILCQIDEPISEEKPGYQFCTTNNLPPVISSITVERLRRAGDKIVKKIEEENNKDGLFKEDKKQIPDIGFKTFDSINAPKLMLENEQVAINFEPVEDSLSRIYNMIFSVGIDDPTGNVECLTENCLYKIGDNYYIINSEKLSRDDFSDILKSGKVFIDGWTADINTTLQNYKEDVKIVF